MDGIIRRTASSHHSSGGDPNEVETGGGSGTARRGAGAGRAHSGQAEGRLRLQCPRAPTASLLVLLLFAAAIIVLNMYMTVLHKLAQQEQEALQYIVELDRLSRKVREIDQRFHYLSKECNLKDGEEVIAELTQRAMETEEDLKTTREQLWDLKLKHDTRLQEYGNAVEDIDHLKRKLAIKDNELIQCRRSAKADPDASSSSSSSLSTHPPGFHWPATTMPKRPPRRLAIIIPHALHHENRLSEFYARSHTERTIPACNRHLPYTQYRDLWVYTNKLYGGNAETDKKKMEEYKRNMMRVNMYNCYGSVNFISANLTEEQDPYPYPPGKSRDNGVIADLFFRIFEMDVFRKNYDYAFVMESDVKPIRPYWLDNIYEHAEYAMEDFWIKGSLYRGLADPKEYCFGIYCGCGDHFNGNSMFRLGDPVFDSFLRFARDTRVDPGKTFGINHDAQLIRVLRDPAVWKFYQRYAHKFVYTEFIQHRQPLIFKDLLSVFNNTYVAHQVVDIPEEPQEGAADDIYLDRMNISLRPV